MAVHSPSPHRERVRNEVFKGQEIGAHRVGSEGAAVAIITYAIAAYALYTWQCNPATGFLLGEMLGVPKGGEECLAGTVGLPGHGYGDAQNRLWDMPGGCGLNLGGDFGVSGGL